MYEIEILLASYNGEQYIRQQIDSILLQTSKHWHLTLSDDGSTDGTPAILDEYVRAHPDRIARVASGKRFGNARDHFFWLIGQSKAKYMLTCDQDDRWYEQKVERIVEMLKKAEQEYGEETPVLAFSDQVPTDAELNPLSSSLMRYQDQYFGHFDYRSLLMQNVVTGGAMGFNRALADLAMKCMNPAQTIMHDWWLAVVAARFGKVIYIDKPLSDYRQHHNNSVGAKNVRGYEYIVNMLADLKEIQKSLKRKKTQAQSFHHTYQDRLDNNDSIFLESFVKSRSGPMFYWKNRKLIHGFFRLAGMMVLG